jgi:hypothetical protein
MHILVSAGFGRHFFRPKRVSRQPPQRYLPGPGRPAARLGPQCGTGQEQAARMTDKGIEQRAERVVALEAELESAGEITSGEAELKRLQTVLHAWVDSVATVVASPGVGRVTLIHRDGSQSAIASPSLPFLLSRPARFD